MNNEKVDVSRDPLLQRTPQAESNQLGLISSTLRHALRFGIVGITATAIHLAVALSLNIGLGLSALASNTAAFFCALLASYLGNLKWVFGAQEHNKIRAGKFFVTAGAGFLLNSTILALLVTQQIMPEALAIVVSVFCVPLATFAAFKFWVFRR